MPIFDITTKVFFILMLFFPKILDQLVPVEKDMVDGSSNKGPCLHKSMNA